MSVSSNSVKVSSRVGSNKRTGFLDEYAKAIVHSKYVFRSKHPAYDVAIVELSRPIPYSENAQPICIADSFRENVGDVGYVVGYGASS
ncbi:transmembrane protease serine 11E-like protein, partial [Aphelenchoides avenae]